MNSRLGAWAVWLYAFGYFASYVPYSALTKALSSGKLGPTLRGLEVLPLATATSVVGMGLFLGLSGWWKDAGAFFTLGPFRIPRPSKWTFFSGVCTAVIVVTTTLAYTVPGASIVLMMVLMRGGVLAMAPVVDGLSRRKVHVESWVALGFTLAALFIAAPFQDAHLNWVAGVIIAAYLGGYFFRLRAMSHLAKSHDSQANRRYFVEEQLVGTPMALLFLGLVAALGPEQVSAPLAKGFWEVPLSSSAGWLVVAGLCSQGTGVFGALVLLSPRENSYTVPVNRISSVWAGVVASWVLSTWVGTDALAPREAWSAAVLTLAVAALSVPSLWQALHKAPK